eukprot:TRINITY_DN59584_c0_g1_i1.p1 TRINITY_DN59584_c0_g1~~TRINITY_DN59584_c0_g1_i1.p1  ORF type:complete len:399 (-),score=58.30 TRINITY_DN59584_c0_g1_i1:79-1275(-)
MLCQSSSALVFSRRCLRRGSGINGRSVVILSFVSCALVGCLQGKLFVLSRGGLDVSRVRCRASPLSDEVGEDAFDVQYLPALDFGQVEALVPNESAVVLPCFPLGSIAYLPHSQQVLNIFEPRYRQMYNDILMSGGRRFVVPYTDREEGTGALKLGEVGVVLYLKDLKEVSEQTEDRVKFVCSHEVIGRTRIKRVLNPRAYADASTYLRVEVEELVDDDLDVNSTDLEHTVKELLEEVGRLQRETNFEVQFRAERLEGLNATRGPGFWGMVELWKNYLGQRAKLLQSKFEAELKSLLVAFFKKSGQGIPMQVTIGDLPPNIQKEVYSMQEQLQEDVKPLFEEETITVQKLIQSESHHRRLTMLQSMLQNEQRRLGARLALKSLFQESEPGEAGEPEAA